MKFSQPQIWQAFNKTADLLDRKPSAYYFSSVLKPQNLQKEACLLGWIGYYLKIPSSVGDYYPQVVSETIPLNEFGFYCTLTKLGMTKKGPIDWHHDARSAAKLLRVYANKYYPIKKKTKKA
jgi:hypothetical protein